MRKLLSFTLVLTGLAFFTSCGDDDEGGNNTPSFTDPEVSSPSAADTPVGEAGTASFSVSVDENATASWTATAEGVTLDATSGTIDGSNTYELPFTAGDNPGAASITLTVSYDETDQTADATAVLNVLAPGDEPIAIADIPATATIEFGDDLANVPYAVDGADGIASFEASVNGGAAVDFTTVTGDDLSTNPTSIGGTGETFTVPWQTLLNLGGQVGSNSIVFTVTDANGSQDQFVHTLTVNPVPEATVEVVTENITDNTTWTADNVYELAGRITVEAGATLTIEPGTVIKGQPGQGANSTALLVARDATLDAQGTSQLPIIFTSTSDEIQPADIEAGRYASPNLGADVQGLWGGVIVLGNAPISASDTEVQIEGIPTSDPNGLYGGGDDTDDSGTISYISIRHGGTNIGEGNEINGLSLGGVGTGTDISWVEVVANQDDGIEWFGGDVDINGILVWNCGDDGLDTDQDWQGTASEFLIVNPQGSAFELDGPEGPDARNGGFHTLNNGTIYAGDDIAFLVDWDDNTNAELTNIYFYGISEGYYPFDDDGTPTDAIASFGGDGSGASASWEITLEGSDTPLDVYGVQGAVDITTEVETNANTVGVENDNNFKWTWPGSDGTLDSIGL